MELIIVILLFLFILYLCLFIIEYIKYKKEKIDFFKKLPKRIEELALRKFLRCNGIVGYSIQNDIYTVFYIDYYGHTKYKDFHKIYISGYLELAEKNIKDSFYYKYLCKPTFINVLNRTI